MFELDRIKEQCPATLVQWFPQLESTNDTAISIVRGGTRLPLLVLCEDQTAGRGQRGNAWLSSSGSLTLSWCFRSPLDRGDHALLQLSPIAGCVVANAIERICPALKLQLKWPNDILGLGHSDVPSKIAGILIESVSTGQGPPCFVVGIGVNVNNSVESIGPIEASTSFSPASLLELTGRDVDLTQLVVEIVGGLERAYLGELANDWWRREFEDRLAFRGQAVRIFNSQGEVELEGRLESVGADGGLILMTSGGRREIYSGTVRPI